MQIVEDNLFVVANTGLGKAGFATTNELGSTRCIQNSPLHSLNLG